MKNLVQLMTYADRLSGGSLKDLCALLDGPLAGVFGGVHILPFYHPVDGADAGFDPIDHTRVDARLGEWTDIAEIARRVDVMADVIVNHISKESPQFEDFLRQGKASKFEGMFLTRDHVFPNGMGAAEESAIYRPRPGAPFTLVQLANGESHAMWTTFTPHQIDIDVQHPRSREYLDQIVRTLAAHGVKMIRLDAVGYAIKKAGSSCFMLPETFDFIAEFAAAARTLGLEVLVEVHSYYRHQIEIARRVDWVYDFALPPLVLHALFFKSAASLKHWIAIRPANAVTVLDTHDGIGIIDIGANGDAEPGLVPPAELDQLVEIIHANSGGTSREATGAAASNLDLYQVNCSFYDALARDDRLYMLARAIQFFLPGVPQVYYVGLLAGSNDMELLRRTGVGRDINRHYYKVNEVAAELNRPVVKDLIALIRRRNSHPAFNGLFELDASGGDKELTMSWRQGAHWARLMVDFARLDYTIEFSPA